MTWGRVLGRIEPLILVERGGRQAPSWPLWGKEYQEDSWFGTCTSRSEKTGPGYSGVAMASKKQETTLYDKRKGCGKQRRERASKASTSRHNLFRGLYHILRKCRCLKPTRGTAWGNGLFTSIDLGQSRDHKYIGHCQTWRSAEKCPRVCRNPGEAGYVPGPWNLLGEPREP